MSPIEKRIDDMTTDDVMMLLGDVPEKHQQRMLSNPVPDKLPRGKPSHQDKKEYLQHLFFFSERLKQIRRKELDRKIMRRSWCYLLEGRGWIDKGEFGHVEDCIDRGRRIGLLPMTFLQDDDSCSWSYKYPVTDWKSPESHFEDEIQAIPERYQSNGTFWRDKDYYIIMLVEKIDLRDTVYGPVCRQFNIPIANARGWSNITTRGIIMDWFDEAWDRGQTPVILYAGDFDPTGIFMGSEEQVKKNFREYRDKPWLDALEVERVGITYEFIQEHDISWIDNLESGSGNSPNESKPWVRDYIEQYGRRKVEANALITPENKKAAQEILQERVASYIGEDAVDAFESKREEKRHEINELLQDRVDMDS